VVAAAASRAPGRVRSLTLVAPAGFGPDADADYLRAFAAASTRRELKPLLGRLFADEALVTRQLVDDVLKYKRLDGVAEALRTLLAVLLEGDGSGDRQAIRTVDLLAGSSVPTAVVWGSADRILPASAAPASRDPDGTGGGVAVRIVEGAGHMVHLESPHTVLEVIESLLGGAHLR
jgi:pyruvate dehydrogenase E2 component (dihydrolipoamide acetyltransferase)